jgi:hypothetical protein
MFNFQSACNLPWWTETNATWVAAFAACAAAIGLIPTLLLQVRLFQLTRRDQLAAQVERQHAEIARQRSDVTCGGVTSILRNLTEGDFCRILWAGNLRHAGFAFEKGLYAQLPEYLRRKCDPFMKEIERPITVEQNRIARELLIFRFPYPNYNAILDDVNRLNFGNAHIVWDEDGKPLNVNRD